MQKPLVSENDQDSWTSLLNPEFFSTGQVHIKSSNQNIKDENHVNKRPESKQSKSKKNSNKNKDKSEIDTLKEMKEMMEKDYAWKMGLAPEDKTNSLKLWGTEDEFKKRQCYRFREEHEID